MFLGHHWEGPPSTEQVQIPSTAKGGPSKQHKLRTTFGAGGKRQKGAVTSSKRSGIWGFRVKLALAGNMVYLATESGRQVAGREKERVPCGNSGNFSNGSSLMSLSRRLVGWNFEEAGKEASRKRSMND